MRPIVHDVGLAFWRLLPANPIVLRVVHMGSRRVQHLWARSAYLLILLFVMLAAYAGQDTAGSLGSFSKSATRMFEYISVLQLAMICLLAPIFTAGAISQEKDAETYNVLLTTPLTNAQIALGSLMSRLFFIIVLLLSGLPIFCITMLYGGVTSEQVFYSFGIAGCSALLTGALAILVSVVRVGTRGTVFSFHATIAIFLFAGLGLGFLPATYVPESIVPGMQEGMTWLAPFHPFWALWVALNQVRPPEMAMVDHYIWPVNRMLASPHGAYMWMTFIVSVVLIALATLFVRRGIKQGEQFWWTRVLRCFGATGGNGERKRRAKRVWANPVAWREAMTRANAATGNRVIYSYVIIGALLGIIVLWGHWWGGWFTSTASARQWLSGLVVFEFVTVLLMATNTAATAITRERESGTMELLLSTPLTSDYIVWGKLRGLVSFAVPLMAVPALTVLLAALGDLFGRAKPPIVSLESALLLPVLLMVYAAFACMLGLHMSLKNTRSVQAVLASVGVLIVVGFGLGMCALGFKGSGPLAALVAPLTFVTSIYSVLNPVEIFGKKGGAGAVSSAAQIKLCVFVGTLIAAGLYSAIVAGIYKKMKNDFDMTVRKQSS